MKKILLSGVCIVMIAVTNNSCKKATRGCTGSKALNKNYDAEAENGSCAFSTAIFYMAVINPAWPLKIRS